MQSCNTRSGVHVSFCRYFMSERSRTRRLRDFWTSTVMQIVRLLKWATELGIDKVHSQICEKKKNYCQLRHVCLCPSVRPRGTVRLPIDRFSLNLTFNYFSKLPRKFKFHENMTRMTATLHEVVCIFTISRSIFIQWEMFKNFLEKNQNTRFMFSNFSRKSCLFEIMWQNVVELHRPQMTMRRMHIACWITKAIDTHSECNAYCFLR
jgi:hypothetical protein